MSKHTPGPWVIDGPDAFGDFTIRATDEMLAIAAVCNGNFRDLAGNTQEHLANAHLIKAAPDLLKALRNITECAEAGSDGANMDLWIEQARAAIAKAEGGQ